MQHSHGSRPGKPARRLVPVAAFALGLALALAPQTQPVLAAGSPSALVVVQADTAKGPADSARPAAAAALPTPPAPPRVPSAPGATAPDEGAPDAADAAAEEEASPKGGVTVDRSIVIHKGSKRVRVEGLGRDREYDSFEQFVQDAPWLAGLVFLTVLLVFLVPLLIVVLLIWYKIRKNRMANETMLKLAERGVVPPVAAMDAVASGNAAALAEAATTTSPGVPAYEHAKALHRRAVWSDLRKGVILGGIGLGLSFWSMLDDGTPNSVGLVFLFVGIGYCVLWYFEDGKRRDPSATPPPGGT